MADQSGLSPMGQWIVWVGMLVMCTIAGYIKGRTDGIASEQGWAIQKGAAHYFLDSNSQRQFEYLPKGDQP